MAFDKIKSALNTNYPINNNPGVRNEISNSKSKNIILKITNIFKTSKSKKIAVVILALLVLLGIGKSVSGKKPVTPATTSNKVTIKDAKSTQTINKDFLFPLKDNNGKELTKIKYTIENAEIRDEIIVQGKPASAVQGKTFLILSIKITNDYDKAIDINARDYVRLTLNNKDKELMAADIHNDPVNVQPISTKVTRIGFPINRKKCSLYI
jgi:hypothetical protein